MVREELMSTSAGPGFGCVKIALDLLNLPYSGRCCEAEVGMAR